MKSSDFSSVLEAFTGQTRKKGTSEAAPLERRDESMAKGEIQTPNNLPLVKAEIGPGDPGYVPKKHQIWRTVRGRPMVFDARKGRGKSIESSGKAPKKVVKPKGVTGGLAGFVAHTITPEERGYKLSTGGTKLRTNISRRKGAKGRRVARTKRKLRVNPITGEVKGRGVKRIPSETLDRLKYGGTNVAVRAGLAGLQAGVEGAYERVAHKARDVVRLSRMDPEMRARERGLRIKRSERKQKTVQMLRRHGVFDAREPSAISGLGREVADSMKITAAAQAAKFVTELAGRKMPFYPIEIRVNPDKMKAMIDYNRDKRTGNIYMRLARTQSTINAIEEGRSVGDPKYVTPQTDEILMELYRVKRDIEGEGTKRYGRGWLQAKSEKERTALVELTIEARKIFRDSFKSARSKGYNKQSSFDVAYKYTQEMIGTSDISMRALSDVSRVHMNLNETPVQAVKNQVKHDEDFRAQVKRIEGSRRLSDTQTQEMLTTSQKARKQAIAETYKQHGAQRPGERLSEQIDERTQRLIDLKRVNDVVSGREKKGCVSQVKMQLAALRGAGAKKFRRHLNQLVHSGQRDRAINAYLKQASSSTDKKTAGEVVDTIYAERVALNPQYGEIRAMKEQSSESHRNPRYPGGETRRSSTIKLDDLEGEINTLDQLRDAVGKIQSKGTVIKMISSAPVAGLALVREDLHSKKHTRQMKRTGRTRRRRYA